MARCEVCGNDYDKAFEVVGHGVESDGHFFCCANCARMVGVQEVRA